MNKGHQPRWYILRGRQPVPAADVYEWARWYEAAKRVVAQTKVGTVLVSTVFLGLDHGFSGDEPLLFETMVFGGPLDGECLRYSNWQQAEDGHAEMVAFAKEAARVA